VFTCRILRERGLSYGLSGVRDMHSSNRTNRPECTRRLGFLPIAESQTKKVEPVEQRTAPRDLAEILFFSIGEVKEIISIGPETIPQSEFLETASIDSRIFPNARPGHLFPGIQLLTPLPFAVSFAFGDSHLFRDFF